VIHDNAKNSKVTIGKQSINAFQAGNWHNSDVTLATVGLPLTRPRISETDFHVPRTARRDRI
jgi:hypothetical protein